MSDRSELDALMAELGVSPLRGARRSSGGGRASRSAPRPPRDPPASSARELSPSSAPPPDSAALVAARAERDAACAERDAACAERDAACAESARLREALDTLRSERDGLTAQARGLHQKLSKAAGSTPPRGQPLAALLAARGLSGEDGVAALRRLLEERADKLLDAVELTAGEALAELLDQRLVLSCGQGPCAEIRGATVLTVPPERCEICGGSGVTRAFRGFAEACRAAGVKKVVIVGGSPTYHRILKHLSTPGRRELKIELIDGKARHRERRIRGLARGADLVLIWGSSILDHATSNAFEASRAQTLTLHQRGIATMLSAVTAHLQRG